MVEPDRIGPRETSEKLRNGNALLVCAYHEEEKFKTFHLERAISLSAFESKFPSLSKDQEIIFYCA
jgi:hypothetical protein